MITVASILEMPPIRVFEVATFYSMFNRSKVGRYHVMLCGTTPCRLQGAEKIATSILKHLGLKGLGHTTSDGQFTTGEMECMGACANSPMVAIAEYWNGTEHFSYTYYEDVSESSMIKILKALKHGDKHVFGSQHRKKAEP